MCVATAHYGVGSSSLSPWLSISLPCSVYPGSLNPTSLTPLLKSLSLPPSLSHLAVQVVHETAHGGGKLLPARRARVLVLGSLEQAARLGGGGEEDGRVPVPVTHAEVAAVGEECLHDRRLPARRREMERVVPARVDDVRRHAILEQHPHDLDVALWVEESGRMARDGAGVCCVCCVCVCVCVYVVCDCVDDIVCVCVYRSPELTDISPAGFCRSCSALSPPGRSCLPERRR